MNTQDNAQHLTHDELLIAAVDKADLSSGRRAHLDACPDCRQNFARLHGRLTRISQMAEQMAPAPKRPFRLPDKQATSARWLLKPVWVMGIAAAMLLAITLLRPNWLAGPKTTQIASFNAAADRQLMEEVDTLVDNALPVEVQQLASLDEPIVTNDTDTDEDFLDWIVPPAEEDQDDESIL